MRILLVVAALCACSSDSQSPHDVVECGDSWPVENYPDGLMCERACKEQPTETGPACMATTGYQCTSSFDAGDDTRGCCAPGPTGDGYHLARFEECAP